MKKILIVLFLANAINAQNIEIKANRFFANEKELYSDLNGSVVIKKGEFDTLWAQNSRIYFDKNYQPTKYIATGNARFEVLINDKHYDGKAEILTYIPAKQIYIMNTDAYLHERESDKKIFGEIIEVSQKDGTYEVKSENKQPVKIIFQIEDK